MRSLIPVLGCLLALVSVSCRSVASVPDRFLTASRAEHNRLVDWTLTFSRDFDDAGELDGMKVLAGTWELADGQLIATAGEAERNRTILVTPCTSEMVKIEFDAVATAAPGKPLCDIAIRFADPETGSFAKHYAMIVGQYYNQATVCYRRNIPIARTEHSPLVSGRLHHVVLEFTRDHLRYWIDGRIVLEAWDRDAPLAVKDTTWIGLSSYDTRLAIDNLRIYAGTPRTKR